MDFQSLVVYLKLFLTGMNIPEIKGDQVKEM